MLLNALKLALDAIRRNLMRAALTVLGVVIGVAAVITMVTLGNGATQAVSNQISSLGSNLLIVRSGQRMGPATERAPSFKLGDVTAILQRVPLAKAAAPVDTTSATVVFGARNWSTSVTGTSAAYFVVRDWSLASGRLFTDAEERSGRAVCVVGDTIRRELFKGLDPVGARIRVKQFSCEIIGLLPAKGQAAMGQDQDDTVIMPLRTVQRRLTGRQDVGNITISVRDGASTARAKAQVEDVLLQFLVESVVLAAFGGLAGVVIAAIASAILARVIEVPFLFDPGINLLAFGVAAVIGIVFGYFPARRAARLDPIEALRRE